MSAWWSRRDMPAPPRPEPRPDGRVVCLICGGGPFKARADGRPWRHRAGCSWSWDAQARRWVARSGQPTPVTPCRVWQSARREGGRCVLTGWMDEISARRFARRVGGEVERNEQQAGDGRGETR